MTTQRKYPHLLSAFFGSAWAILPEKLEAVALLLELRSRGVPADPDFEARSPAPPPTQAAAQGVAILPLFGVLTHRGNLLAESSGATSLEEFGAAFDEVVRAPNVRAVVLDVDSPGGSVYGVPEAAARVYRARGKKPVVAVANSLMASAAYWVASAAEQVVVTPSADVGGIGVFAIHQDESKANEEAGVKHTVLKAGKYKAEGIPEEPLSDDARAYLQGRVDTYYQAFAEDVAKFRGTTPGQVKGGYGEGRTVGAEEAVRLGLADRVGTLERVLRDLTARPASASRTAARVSRNRAVAAGVQIPADGA